MMVKDISQKYQDYIKLHGEIGDIPIAPEMGLYNELRYKYYQIALKVKESYIQTWNGYDNYGSMVKQMDDDFESCMEYAYEEIANDLISMGIYDMDKKAIVDYASEFGVFNNYLDIKDEFLQTLGAIQQELNNKVAEREIRKQTRGRWQGGTIHSSNNTSMVDSYKNDIKFQLELGARNVIEGAGHELINAIGNSISTSNANKKMDAVFRDNDTKENFLFGVFTSAWNLHLILIPLLEQQVPIYMPQKEELDKGERLLNNISNPTIPEEERKRIFIDAIKLNPFSEKCYKEMLIAYPNDADNITKIADYFHVDLTEVKDSLALDYLNSNLGETENDAESAKEALLEYYKKIQLKFSPSLASYQRITDVLNEFDLAYRTVDSVVCATRDGADKAREELPAIEKFMKTVKEPAKDDLLEYEKQVIEQREEFSKLFQSELTEKYIGIIDGYLAQFEKNFCNTGFFKSSNRKEAGIARANKLAKSLDVSSEENVDIAIAKVREILPSLGLTEEEAHEAFERIARNREKVVNPSSGQQLLNKLGGFFNK